MTAELLEERLRNLAVQTPDAGRVSARILAARANPSGPPMPRIALGAVAFVVLAALIAYFVPAADTAVADVPFAGEMLRDAGLVGARDRITMVNATSTSAGYTLKLAGAYADSSRTVLLLNSNPPSLPGFGNAVQLTDQFGRSYAYQGGVEDMRTGEETMQFEPLAWPDAITGARITLHVTSLQPPDATGIGPAVAGSWTLRASLGIDVAKALPLPASASLGPAHFTFTSVSYSPATIEVDMTVSGVTDADLSRVVPGNSGKGSPALTVIMLDPSGQIINGTGGSGGGLNATNIRFFGFRQSGPGNYTLRVGYYGYGTFERLIAVP